VIEHLIRACKEIVKGIYIWSYDNGDYKYRDLNDIEHLIHNGKEIVKGTYIWNYDKYYEVRLENGLTIKILME